MLINNRYQVIRPLGEGGFGHAYLAEDTQMPSKRKCVIKQLKPITTSPEVYQVVQDRFQREAAILEQLGENHPQIPRLYAYFTEAQKFYLVQEWIDGETLEELVVPQPESVVTNVIVSLLPVLDFIHQRGIIHRDLKPENIILRSGTGKVSGQPVLIDFGAVRETMGTVMNSRNHPTSSIVIGTPGYMSAEQAAGRPIPSSDLYSLGLTAIYLLTGQMPQALQLDPQTGELVWQQWASQVSVGLRAILDRAVRSHPRDRYSTASEMLRALSTLPGVSIASPLSNVPPSDRASSGLPATVLPAAVLPAVLPSQPPLQVPTASTPAASELQTMAVAATPATHQQSPQTAFDTVVTGNSRLSDNAAQPRQPWFRKLTPLTIGLSVLLIGGSAIALGMVISQGSVDTSVQPLRSGSSPADSDSSIPEDADEGKGTTTESATDAPSAENDDADRLNQASPSPARDDPAPPNQDRVEIVTGPVVFSDSQPVTLGNTSTGQIDVYEQPSFLAETPSYGVSGDRVLSVGETVRAETGLIWYKVRFDSGVEGWIPESNIVSFGSPPPADSVPATPQAPTSADILSRAPKYTTLSGASSDRINVRSSPSTSANSPHYGVGGDPVQILDAVRGNDGYNWYLVAFESGAEGWVREDLIRL